MPVVCVDRICGMVFNSVTTAAAMASVPVNSEFSIGMTKNYGAMTFSITAFSKMALSTMAYLRQSIIDNYHK